MPRLPKGSPESNCAQCETASAKLAVEPQTTTSLYPSKHRSLPAAINRVGVYLRLTVWVSISVSPRGCPSPSLLGVYLRLSVFAPRSHQPCGCLSPVSPGGGYARPFSGGVSEAVAKTRCTRAPRTAGFAPAGCRSARPVRTPVHLNRCGACPHRQSACEPAAHQASLLFP